MHQGALFSQQLFFYSVYIFFHLFLILSVFPSVSAVFNYNIKVTMHLDAPRGQISLQLQRAVIVFHQTPLPCTGYRIPNEPIKLSLMLGRWGEGEATLIFCRFNIECDTVPSSTRAVMTRCQVTRPAIITMEIRQLVLQRGKIYKRA